MLLNESSPLHHSVTNWRKHLQYLELTRLHKFPLGSILIFFPSAWGITMAAYAVHASPQHLFVQIIMFGIGSTLLHSAACVLNDICDVEFDRQVERTKLRPLVTGAVSIFEAWIILLSLVSTCLCMLLLMNKKAAALGVIGIFPLHALYPLTKRWTWWPQAWLGVAMNWSFPVGWAAMAGELDIRIIGIFFGGTVCWTIVYDTIYACQDRADDIKAGVKSTAILFGEFVHPILCGFASMFVLCMGIAGYLNKQGLAFYLISVGSTVLFFIWQFYSWNPEDPGDCAAKFKANGWFGYFVLTGMVLDYCTSWNKS